MGIHLIAPLYKMVIAPLKELPFGLFEHYNTGDDTTTSFYDVYWQSQTFTPSVSHKITSVKMLIWGTDYPIDVIVSIRATTDEKPSGNDFVSKTVNSITFPIGSPGDWFEFDFNAGVDLLAGVRYAIVARAPDAVYLNAIAWRMDFSLSLYVNGERGNSSDAGLTWFMSSTKDLMFEEWGY